jgi:hypothetical protein
MRESSQWLVISEGFGPPICCNLRELAPGIRVANNLVITKSDSADIGVILEEDVLALTWPVNTFVGKYAAERTAKNVSGQLTNRKGIKVRSVIG